MTLPPAELGRDNILAAVRRALETLGIPGKPSPRGTAVAIDFHYGEEDYATCVSVDALTDDCLYVTSCVPLCLPEGARLPVLLFLNEVNRRIHCCTAEINLASGGVEVRLAQQLTELPGPGVVATALRMVCDLVYSLTEPLVGLACGGWDLPRALLCWYEQVGRVGRLRAGPAADAVFIPPRPGGYLPRYDPARMTVEIDTGKHAIGCGSAAEVRPGEN